MAKWVGGQEETQIHQLPMDNEANDFEEFTQEDWSEWEWVMSTSEEFLQKHNQWQMEKTESELNILRGTSSQVRRHFTLSYFL